MTDLQEAMKIIRQAWYDENNRDTTDMDAREIAMHVGIKCGLIRAMNLLSRKENDTGTQ